MVDVKDDDTTTTMVPDVTEASPVGWMTTQAPKTSTDAKPDAEAKQDAEPKKTRKPRRTKAQMLADAEARPDAEKDGKVGYIPSSPTPSMVDVELIGDRTVVDPDYIRNERAREFANVVGGVSLASEQAVTQRLAIVSLAFSLLALITAIASVVR